MRWLAALARAAARMPALGGREVGDPGATPAMAFAQAAPAAGRSVVREAGLAGCCVGAARAASASSMRRRDSAANASSAAAMVGGFSGGMLGRASWSPAAGAGSGDFGVHRFVDPAVSFRKFGRGIEIDVGQRGFGQGTAALLRAAVEAGGVAAQTEDQQDGDIFRHREADRAEGGEAERDDLGDRQEVGRVARDVGVDGLDRSGLGTDWIAVGGGEEKWCQGGADDLHEQVGMVWFCFGHASRPELRLRFGFSAILGILSSLIPMAG